MLLIRRVTGHSMLPGFRPGDIIVARRWPRRPKLGAVVIIRHGGIEKIKRVTRLGASQIYVEGDNPDGSTDSRQFGWLGYDAIYAAVVWPRSKRPPGR